MNLRKEIKKLVNVHGYNPEGRGLVVMLDDVLALVDKHLEEEYERKKEACRGI